VALRGTPELVQRILDHKNFKDVVLTDQECALLMKYKIDNPQIQLREEHYRQLLTHATDSLDQVVTFLEKEKFDLTARFANGDSVLHALTGRKNFDNHASVMMDRLLALKDSEGHPAVNVNARNNNGDRAIDLAGQNKAIVSSLREHGSVEPKNQITAAQQLEKIIFDTNRAPDGIDGDNKKTVAILSKMYKDYPLTEVQINNEIEVLKKRVNQEIEDSIKKLGFAIHNAEWGGEVNTVPKVIDALCEMRNVTDRLADSWDFKKVLGTTIHVAKTGEDSTPRLIDGLSQIRLCNLSKLMNMLGTVQDKIVEVKGIDYSKKTLMDFSEMLEGTLIKVNETYNEKAPLALAKWVNDLTNRREVDDPDKWSGYPQVIRGVMNSQMSKIEGVDFASSNYNDGIQTVIIPNLQEFLDPSNIQTKSTNPTIAKWQKQVEEGRTMMAIEVFDKIVQDKANLGILEEASWNYDLSLGVQVAMPAKVLEEYAGKIEARHGAEVAKAFVNSLKDNLERNDEAIKYLESYTVKGQEQNKDLKSQAMSQTPQAAKTSTQNTPLEEIRGRSESYAEMEIQRRSSGSRSPSSERS
jgi:hypothetical protein